MADGRVARLTRTQSEFGVQLDSLADVITFGCAPALLLYRWSLHELGFGGIFIAFLYLACGALRLARFNVDQAGHAKSHFIGLPSPTAGMILATYYPFSQTPFFQANLSHLPWPRFMGIGMVLLAVVMLSHIPYPVVPRIGFRSKKSLFVTVVMAACAVGALLRPALFLFPFLAMYTLVGLIRSVGLGLLDALPARDPLLDEDDPDERDEAGAEIRSMDYAEIAPTRPRRDPSNPQERD